MLARNSPPNAAEIETKTSKSLIKGSSQEDFNRRLRKDPKNISLWIEFVQFQDENYGLPGNKPRKLIDRKISILKRAIECNCHELELTLMHLKLAGEIEDSSSLMKLWEGYLKKRDNFTPSDYFKLTMEWLNFLQNRFLAFSFDQVNEAFSEAFLNLQDPALYKPYFKFLRRCGFTERIVAISQSSIEVNVEYYNYGEVDIEAYEDQWDSGLVEHVGDSIFRELSLSKPSYCPPADQDKFGSSLLSKWLHIERYRECNFWHPIHFDLEDCEGQVIFDDIKDFILLPNNQKDSLPIISSILSELGIFIGGSFNNFNAWYVQIYKELLPFFNTDWKYIYRLLTLFPSPEAAESFAKKLLSENRDSLECFMAYGKFQEFLGNTDIAVKIYESIKKRSKDIDCAESFPKQLEFDNELAIDFGSDLKSSVYDLVRSNPGNKNLYMEIIEITTAVDEDLSMEVFNLIDEQQIRLHTLFDEINLVMKE